MSDFVSFLQHNAIYSAQNFKSAAVAELLSKYELQVLSKGMNTKVYKIKEEDWIVKEGRWDWDIHLTKNLKLPFPRSYAEKILRMFQTTIMPTPDFVQEQYEFYLQLCHYLGFFNTDNYYHPDLIDLRTKQKHVRDNLANYREAVNNTYKLQIQTAQLEPLLRFQYFNFLPQEYLLYGKALDPASQGKDTYFIFQKYIKGETLHDVQSHNLQTELRIQLQLFVYLVLIMHMEVHLLPDTRPRLMATQYNWLECTDNIIVSNPGIMFIDTRLIWDTLASNWIKRGLFIPELTIGSMKRYIQKRI